MENLLTLSIAFPSAFFLVYVMCNTLHKIVTSLFIFAVIVVFSGCAEKTIYTLSSNNKSSKPLSHLQSAKPSNESDDRDLLIPEPQMCLVEELSALRQTGLWDEPIPLHLHTDANEKKDNNFPIVINKQVNMYLSLFKNRQRKQFARWLARSGRYRQIMEKELIGAGLPTDLIYLSMIESGYMERACSKSRAMGLWQFMKSTGRMYNLKVNRYVDERRDANKSSKAAASYLKDLYEMFGDWHLAVAAYNAGPGKIRYGLKKYKVDNFWDLASKKYLRLETKRYVPKLIAALIIAKNPEKYGFTNIVYKKPLEYDTISVGPGMDLKAIGVISKSSRKKIKALNPELRTGKTPLNTSRYLAKIPKGTKTVAQKNMQRLHSIASTGYKTHKIRKGDTLSKICSRYGINTTTLLKVNNLRSRKLVAGKNLRIPYSTISYQLIPEGSSGAMAAFKDKLILHRIKPGDTVSRIATRYNVPAQMIVAWNGLKNSHSIRAGQQLALYTDRSGKKKSNKQSSQLNKSKIVTLKSETLKKIASKTLKSEFHLYSVKNGDSLWTISRKFRASPKDIRKWNNLKSNLIHPGSKLKLKKG